MHLSTTPHIDLIANRVVSYSIPLGGSIYIDMIEIHGFPVIIGSDSEVILKIKEGLEISNDIISTESHQRQYGGHIGFALKLDKRFHFQRKSAERLGKIIQNILSTNKDVNKLLH